MKKIRTPQVQVKFPGSYISFPGFYLTNKYQEINNLQGEV